MTKIVGSMNTHPPSRVAIIALMMSVLTVVVVIMSTIGFRMELWGYGSSLKILRVAVFGGVTAIVLSIIGIALTWPGRDRRGLVISIAALLIIGPTLVTPLYWNYSKSKLPRFRTPPPTLRPPCLLGCSHVQGLSRHSGSQAAACSLPGYSTPDHLQHDRAGVQPGSQPGA